MPAKKKTASTSAATSPSVTAMPTSPALPSDSQLAKDIFARIQARRERPWSGEEEVRIGWVAEFESALGVHFDAERAKKDSSYNNIILEFKAPGLFNGKKDGRHFKNAMNERLLPYITRAAEKADCPTEDFIGIAIDGDHICFAHVSSGQIFSEHLLPFSEYSVGLVLSAFRADTRRAVTSENLMRDFGHGTSNAKALMQALSDALALELQAKGNTKIKMLFEEWRALYGQVADMSVLQADAINKEMCFSWGGSAHLSIPGRLFVIHTYNSLLIKLLAAEIVASHGLTAISQPAQTMSALEDDNQLLQSMSKDIEKGALFEAAGIKGFVEEAIFSWYLDVASAPAYSGSIISALRLVLASLSLYRTDRLSRTRDVLRDLYHGLVPGKLRQSLGEFYTPDWLVDYTINIASNGSWLNKRSLDPTCGSGAFVIALVRKIREEASVAGWDTLKILNHLCTSVWGFDLNPLAVQTTRVNFLMEIADLMQKSPGTSVEIPVLLADAIYSPAANPNPEDTVVSYQIGSQVAGLDISLPAALAFDRERLDDIFIRMGEDVESDREFDEVQARLVKSKLISKDEAQSWGAPLKNTYDQILDLHRQQWNGIWFRIVRNFFWSATAGHFDCIVGNPPWVRWSKLPELYRNRVKPTCERYGIFSKNKRHGGNELDISAMITYTTADKWLKPDGRLAFVITGTLFKNPSSAGFRTFKIEPSNPASPYLAPLSVDDLKELKPFEDASNHTVVAVFEKKNKETKYPVPYRVWSAKSGETRSIPGESTLQAVLNRVVIGDKEATPVADLGSPWAVLAKGRYKILKGLSGTCSWAAGRKGITADLNGVYFVPILRSNANLVEIESRPDAGRKSIGPARKAWVEPELLYPLIKGAGDFEPCYLKLDDPTYAGIKLFTFVPNSGIGESDYAAAESHMNSPALVKTKAWFKQFDSLLDARSTYKRQMLAQDAPNYAVYNVGDYSFKPWKVIWPEMSTRFFAAVAGSAVVPIVGSRPYVPDHKVYFAAFDDKTEAHFLCGLLNSSLVREWVESHNVSIQVGDIFKHLQLPNFDANNKDHQNLARLVEKSHGTHANAARALILKQVLTVADNILQTWLLPVKPIKKVKTVN